ncbi:MAG: hypothetical protein AAGE84_19745 [Cyanobacteria bacterium P01_G01_bin.39]
MSHESNLVNQNFYIPDELINIEFNNYFQHKPLIKSNTGKYLLVSSVYCAPAFYEAIAAKVRDLKFQDEKGNIKIGDRLGYQLEDVIK